MKPRGVSWESKNGYGRRVEKDSVYFMRQIPGGVWNWKPCWAQNLLSLSSDDFSVYNGGNIAAQQNVWPIYGGISRKCWNFLATIMQQSLKYFCH
jgi:hypothetical protein